jgi:hypothetical protein
MKKILLCGLIIGTCAQQSTLASVNADSAANYTSGWSTGSNGGGGFEPWNITATAGSGYAENGIWASSNADLSMGNAFGFTAKGDGASIYLDRSFSQAMAAGDVFTVDLGLNYDAGTGGNKGFVLRTADNREIVTVNQADSQVLTVNGTTAFTNYGTATMHWTFTQKSATQIQVYATGRGGSESFATVLTTTGDSYISNIRFYATSITNDEYADLRQVFFDNMVLSQGAGTGTFTYSVEDSRTIITGISTNASGAITIPATLGGYTVTEIGRSAFRDLTNITSVTFASPASVTNIGPTAFQGCTGLMLAVLPTAITSISEGLFSGCSQLRSVTIPTSVTSIGAMAFAGCRSLNALALPASLSTLGESAFLNCRSLTSLDIPDRITSIPGQLCYECRGLTAVDLPSGLTSIGYGAFYNCLGLSSLDIPAGVTTLGANAFHGCSGIVSLSLNCALGSVGNQAFYACSALQTECFYGGVSSLGDAVFGNCVSLEGVYFVGNQPSLGADGGADMFSTAGDVTVYYLSSSSSWGNTFCGVSAQAWEPTIGAPFISGGAFQFTVQWATGLTFRVQACTDLGNPTWTNLLTNTLASESYLFSDADWASYDRRFYRVLAAD